MSKLVTRIYTYMYIYIYEPQKDVYTLLYKYNIGVHHVYIIILEQNTLIDNVRPTQAYHTRIPI